MRWLRRGALAVAGLIGAGAALVARARALDPATIPIPALYRALAP
ncbi:MAG: hypothetical protein U5K36_02705 [Roseovarius sp.]|nr:hypothetical protein [Roseovarius sp.]